MNKTILRLLTVIIIYNCIINIFLLVFYKHCNVQCYVNQSNVHNNTKKLDYQEQQT